MGNDGEQTTKVPGSVHERRTGKVTVETLRHAMTTARTGWTVP